MKSLETFELFFVHNHFALLMMTRSKSEKNFPTASRALALMAS